MYAVTSTPLDRRTRATLRSAELGFLGVMILTWRQTPFFWGQPCKAGCLGRRYCCTRGLRTNWLIVGISDPVGLVCIRRREFTVVSGRALVKMEEKNRIAV